MWLKKLFTIPEGKKITEKIFSRILVSSICSILLCMSCLFGMTWAWFTVDIVNRGNVIQIADVTLSTEIPEQAATGVNVYELAPGTYQLKVAVTNTSTKADAFDYKAPVYVRMSVTNEADEVTYYYLPFGTGSGDTEVTLELYHVVTIGMEADWAAPGSNETEITGGALTIGTPPVNAANPADADNADNTDVTESVSGEGTDPDGTDTVNEITDSSEETAAQTPSEGDSNAPQDSTDVS